MEYSRHLYSQGECKMSYRCPLCGYRTISLQGLKMHFQKRHATDVCPICGKKSRNIVGHYYIVARTHSDPQHLLLFYLSKREVLDNAKKEEVEKLLTTVKI